MELREGMKVRVLHTDYPEIPVGPVTHIVDVDDDNATLWCKEYPDGLFFFGREFEVVTAKFKVGDRVQANFLLDDDDPGTVTGYSGGCYSVRWDSDSESGAACIWSESELRLVAPAPTTIADIVRRLEALEAAALPAPEFNIGDKVTLTATVSGMNKRRVNIIIDGVPPASCSLAVPPTALIAA